jgi:hypothetical protein
VRRSHDITVNGKPGAGTATKRRSLRVQPRPAADLADRGRPVPQGDTPGVVCPDAPHPKAGSRHQVLQIKDLIGFTPSWAEAEQPANARSDKTHARRRRSAAGRAHRR